MKLCKSVAPSTKIWQSARSDYLLVKVNICPEASGFCHRSTVSLKGFKPLKIPSGQLEEASKVRSCPDSSTSLLHL